MARLDDATGSVVVRQRLDPHPSSVSHARRIVSRALGDLGRTELVDDATLVVSELVTNALVHAGTPIEVVVSQRDTEILVEVVDENPRLPFRRRHAELAGTGRGLQLVEQLATAWGARDRPPGKAVWFQVGGPRADEPPEAGHGPTDAGAELSDEDLDALLAAFPDLAEAADMADAADVAPPDGDNDRGLVDVVLLQVPLLLHAAWQMQAESVLREYLLTRLAGDDDDVEAELEAHAAVHGIVVLLQEHVPAPALGTDPDELVVTAVEPLVTAERLVLPVPVASLEDVTRMEAALDAAMALAEAGALLTPPTQPEVRAFRRWVCRQIREQHAGAAPEPWLPDLAGDVMSTLPAPVWDPTDVATATVPVVAAADDNRILAVSPAATRLLGYDDGELVGRRIVDIIPTRYRQAHLAGFTLHLFAGRRPLIEHRIAVPALRRDGSEVTVELYIESVSLAGGRHVFLAQLAAAGPDPEEP